MPDNNINQELSKIGKLIAVEIYNNRLKLPYHDIRDSVAAGLISHYIEKVSASPIKIARLLDMPIWTVLRVSEKYSLPISKMPTKYQPETQPDIEIAQEYERPKPHIKPFGQVKIDDDVKW